MTFDVDQITRLSVHSLQILELLPPPLIRNNENLTVKKRIWTLKVFSALKLRPSAVHFRRDQNYHEHEAQQPEFRLLHPAPGLRVSPDDGARE